MNNLQKLHALGQSVWCDNISRRMIDSGELQRLIDIGIVGVTSNPTIFMKAITGSADYDVRIAQILAGDHGSGSDGDDSDRFDLNGIKNIYEKLVIPDIADAADILRPVYDRTNGVDGYISLEVSPKLAYNTPATVAEAKRLFKTLNRPNVFIKVPATSMGIPAIEMLIADGINVNVTLIFSIAVYREVAAAYINGLQTLQKRGGDLSKVASVASFFVSRVDTAVDKLLTERREKNNAKAAHLLGKAAIANAKLAYARFKEMFDPAGPFGALAASGGRVQRPLWASTSKKNPEYRDTIYVDELVGANTVNTMPPETIQATFDHGRTEITIDRGVEDAQRTLAELGNLDINLTAVTDQLTFDGVKLFAQSFQDLLENIAKKETQLRARSAASGA
ncbi:MAG: transaldolase [Planctomycetes bacterium]|nr:transaldolase [Planctomycetota bacterium]MBI3833788.1 transaldolase [Planctomycetota bacterium]